MLACVGYTNQYSCSLVNGEIEFSNIKEIILFTILDFNEIKYRKLGFSPTL